eukprot:EG_transcript_18375
MVISNDTADAALVFVTILNRPHRDCCNLFASAVHHGILLHVIGWEHPDLNTWNPEGYFEVLSDYLQTVDEKSILVLVHGGDVVLNGGRQQFSAAYNSLGRRPVVFGADAHCHYPEMLCAEWLDKNNKPHQWPDAGFVMGSVKDVRRIANWAKARVHPGEDPTLLFGLASLNAQLRENIHIDSMQQFMLTFKSHNAVSKDICFEGRRPKSCSSDVVPLTLHDKSDGAAVLRRLWWWGIPLQSKAFIFVNGRHRYIEEMCPDMEFT